MVGEYIHGWYGALFQAGFVQATQQNSSGSQNHQAAEEKTLAWISKFTAKFDEDLDLGPLATCCFNAADTKWSFGRLVKISQPFCGAYWA